MKQVSLILLLFLSIARYSFGAEAIPVRLIIVTPPPNAIVESELISIVLRLGGNTLEQVEISVNNRIQAVVKSPNRHFLCKEAINLSYGLNKIKIICLKDGKKVEEVSTDIFYSSDLSRSSSSIPLGFKRYSFHVDFHEKACVSCHEKELGRTDSKAEAGERSPCYTCHKKMLDSNSFVHGPAAVWSCQMCHDAKAVNRKMGVEKPDSKICINCHENSWNSKKFQHGPTAAGSCTTCHNPHASNHTYFLRVSKEDLCMACHDDILGRPHVTSGFSGNHGHPVRKYTDPYNPGREFSCVSCHNPHASDSPGFLNGYETGMEMQQFCKTCHKI